MHSCCIESSARQTLRFDYSVILIELTYNFKPGHSVPRWENIEKVHISGKNHFLRLLEGLLEIEF